jgi:hypothetical protein
MAVDPVSDCSFWYTNEYYPVSAASTWKTRVGTFTIPECGGVIPIPIFSDGFESGNLAAWDGKFKDGNDLLVTQPAAMVGVYGMRALIDDNIAIFVQDESPNGESIYNIVFHFDPHSIAMANLDTHTIFLAQDFQASWTSAIQVEFRSMGGAYQLRARARNDNLTWTNTNWFTITDAPHQIEVEWDAATGPGQNDGKLKFKIDGLVKGNRTGLDNDTLRIDRARFGAPGGIDTGTRGTEFFDQFESFTE